MSRKKVLTKKKDTGRLKGWEKKYMMNMIKYDVKDK